MAREWARRYWRELLRYLQQEGIQLQARQPRANDRFQAFDIGRRTFFLEACFCERDPVLLVPAITVRLRMSGKDAPAHYHLLKRHCEQLLKNSVNLLNGKSIHPTETEHRICVQSQHGCYR